MSIAWKQSRQNPLLAVDDVGRAAPTTRDLPEFGFVFGKGKEADLEGTKEIMSEWATHKRSSEQRSTAVNHIKKNKAMVGTKSAKMGSAGTTTQSINPADVDPQYCFGSKNRPSTPIRAVIECHFGAEYEAHAEELYADLQNKQKVNFRPKMTKAAAGHALGAEKRLLDQLTKDVQQPEEFKLTKFKNVKSSGTCAPHLGK